MSTIGILGGMGPQASSLLHELIIARAHKFTKITSDEDFPDIVHLSVPVPNFTQNENNRAEATKILKAKLPVLEKAGCDINVIACNTAHLLLPELQADSSLRFLSMPKLAMAQADSLGMRRVGLLGSQTTIKSNLFDVVANKDQTLIRPSDDEQRVVNQLIMKQIQGVIKCTDRKMLRDLIDNFIKIEQLDGVVLGCTELPVIVGEHHPKTVSSLHVLVDGLLKKYFEK